MNSKIKLVLAHLDAHNKVTLKMDRASGFQSITITKRGDKYVVGTIPGARLVSSNRADVRAMLIENSIYVEGWK